MSSQFTGNDSDNSQHNIFFTALSLGTVSAAMTYCIWCSGEVSAFDAFLPCSLFIGALYLFGLSIGVPIARHMRVSPNTAFFLALGTSYLGVALFFLTFITSLSTIHIFYLLSALSSLSVILQFLYGGLSANIFRESQVSLAVIVFALAAAMLWSVDSLWPFTATPLEQIFKPWSDVFIHASTATNFRSPGNAFLRGNSEMAGYSIPFYHYASFCLAAVFADLTRISSLTASCAFSIPFGIFFLTISVYTLWASLRGELAGFLACIFSIVLPDVSHYALRNKWFSYYWMQHNGVSICFGMGVACLALLFLLQAIKLRDFALLIVGLLFTLIVLAFKAQIFVPFSLLAVVLTLFWCVSAFRAGKRTLVLSLITIGALILVALLSVISSADIAPTVLSAHSGFPSYLPFVIQQMVDTELAARFQEFFVGTSRPVFYLAGAGFVLISSFGLLLIAYPTLALILKKKQKLDTADVAPAIALVIYTGVFLILPRNEHIAAFVIQHRGSLWVYLLLSSYCGAALLLLLPSRMSKAAIISCIALTGLSVPFLFGEGVHASGPGWAHSFTNTALPNGLIKSAEFVRNNAKTEEIVQSVELSPKISSAALTDRFNFIVRPELHGIIPGREAETARRMQLLHDLREADSGVTLNQLIRTTGIAWLIVFPEIALKWPEKFQGSPAFVADGFRVFYLAQLSHKAEQ